MADLAGPLYLGPVRPELAVAGPWAMPWISARLRRPDGCPWDREQTHESLRKHLLEEAYEVYDALGRGASPELAGELGDLLLQVVLHAQLAAEAGVFDLTDVQAELGDEDRPSPSPRLRRRRGPDGSRRDPPVGDDQGGRAGRCGRRCRARRAPGSTPGRPRPRARSTGSAGRCRRSPPARRCRSAPRRSATTGRPSMGSWTRSTRSWPSWQPPRPRTTRPRRSATCSSCSSTSPAATGSRPRPPCAAANDKFRRRFGSVERMAAARGVALRDLDFAELDELWDAAKDEERAAQAATKEPHR